MEDDDALDNSVILDTAGDIVAKFEVHCGCGETLLISDISDSPEAISIIVEKCYTCAMREHTAGYFEGQEHN